MKTTRNIAIVYFDAASAHRSAAAALQKVLQKRQPHCQVRLVNITDVFDHHPLFGKIVRTGIGYFNRQLQRDRVFNLRSHINLARLCHNLVGDKGIQQMANYWNSFKPDVVLSVTPMFNPVLYKSAMEMNPAVQCITIPLGFEEVRPRYWFTPEIMQFYLNASQQLQRQAVKAGIPEKHCFRIDGMPVEPGAYEPAPMNRNEQLRTIGLNPGWPVGFLSFGAQGTRSVLKVIRALAKQHPQLNLIIMCGKNKALFSKLSTLNLPFPTAMYSYLPDTPIHLLRLADFVIGKPGAITITESLITQIPLIALKSKGMRPLQKASEEWLTKTACGTVAATPSTIAAAVTDVVNNPAYKERMIENNHQAVFQIAAYVEEIGKLNTQTKMPLLTAMAI